MAQKVITVGVTDTSTTVTLSDTSDIIAGKSFFKLQNTYPGEHTDVYQVQSIVTDTSVTLTGAFSGTTGNYTGLFMNDFSSNLDLPYVFSGDLDIPDFINRAFNILDGVLATGSDASLKAITLSQDPSVDGPQFTISDSSAISGSQDWTLTAEDSTLTWVASADGGTGVGGTILTVTRSGTAFSKLDIASQLEVESGQVNVIDKINITDSFANEQANFVYNVVTGLTISTNDPNPIVLSSGGSEVLAINGIGSIYTNGGSSVATDVGGLNLFHGAADGHVLTFENSDVTHPFTTQQSDSSIYTEFEKQSAAQGGVRLTGYREGSGSAVQIRGYRETIGTTPTASGVVQINVLKSDGGTSATALADGDNAFTVANNGTNNFAVMGNGDVVSQGDVTAVNGTFTGPIIGTSFGISGNIDIRSYTASDTDITGLISGSNFGSIIEGDPNGHLVAGIRGDDSNDSFSVISGGGNYGTDSTYDTLCMRVFANGDTIINGSFATGGQASGNVDSGGITIDHGANDGDALEFINSDVAHPFTGLHSTNVYGVFKKQNSTEGGLKIIGYGETTAAGLTFAGYRQSLSSVDSTNGAILFDAYESDGLTGAQAPASDDTVYAFKNGGSQGVVFKGNGEIRTVAGLTTGGESSPDAHVCLQQNADDGNALSIKNTDVAHAFTGVSEADTYFEVRKANNTLGGVSLRGFSESTATAFGISGYKNTPATSSTGNGCVSILAYKSDGATGTAALADNEVALSIQNTSSTKIAVYGNGDLVSQGDIQAIDGRFTNKAVIGNSTTEVAYTSLDHLVVGDTSGSHGIVIESDATTGTGALTFGDGALAGRIEYDHANNDMAFTTNGTEYMVLSSTGILNVSNRINLTENNAVTRTIFQHDGSELEINVVDSMPMILKTGNTERLRIGSTGILSTNETAPDVDPYGLCLNTGSADGNVISFKNSDIAHGFSSLQETDTYAVFKKLSATEGGLQIAGYHEASDSAVNIRGYRTTAASADTSNGVITFNAYKSDGGTGATTLADGEQLLAIKNQTTIALAVKGNGDLISSNEVFAQGAVIDEASGNGIKVGDTTTNDFPWRDILGQINLQGSGANDPSWSTITGNFKAWQFAVNDEVWIVYHVPHDIVPSSDIHFHVHWTTGGTSTNTVKWQVEYAYAKGFNQAAFNFASSTTITMEEAASGTAYQHMVTESAAQTISGLTEPDGLIVCHLSRITNGGTNNPNSIYVFTADVHYQSTNIGTIDKAPNFYT